MDLTLDLYEEEHTISGSLEYSKDLFDRGTVERIAGHLEARHLLQHTTLVLGHARGRSFCAACAGALSQKWKGLNLLNGCSALALHLNPETLDQ